MYKAIHDNVLIKVIHVPISETIICITDEAPSFGIVMSSGEGLTNNKGLVLGNNIKESDFVVFASSAINNHTKLQDETDLYILKASQIWGTVDEKLFKENNSI